MKSYNKDIHWRRITHGGVGIHPTSSVQSPQSQMSTVRDPKSRATFRGSAPVWYEKWHGPLSKTGSSCYDSPVPQQQRRTTTYVAVDECIHTDLVDVNDDELKEKKETIRPGCWNDLMKKSTDKHQVMIGPVKTMKRPSLDATETYLTEDSLDEIHTIHRKVIGVNGNDEKEQIHTTKQMQLVDMEICLEDEHHRTTTIRRMKERRDINGGDTDFHNVNDDDDFDLISTASASSSSFSMSDNFDDFDNHNNLHNIDEEAVAMIGSDDHFASIFNTWDADDCTATVIDDKVIPTNVTSTANDVSNKGIKVISSHNKQSSCSTKNNIINDDNVSISSSFLSLREPTPFNMPPLLTSHHWNNIDIPSIVTTVDEITKSVTDNIVADVTMSLMDTDDTVIFDHDDDNESIDFLFDDENNMFSYNIEESKDLTTAEHHHHQQQQQQRISFNDMFEERRSQLAASMAASRRTRNRCFLTDGCGVMKGHASLSHILRDIERSSHVVARNIVLHHPSNHTLHQNQLHHNTGGVNRCSVQQMQQQKQQLSSKRQ